MITAEKLSIFKDYKGYYDGYYIQNKGENRLVSDDEWFLLNNFMQDIYMIRHGLASKLFEVATKKKLIEECDNEETYNLVFEVEKYLNG